MSTEETTYFFSYARADAEFVLKLAKELRAAGANLWVDQLDILAGERWDRAVEKALMACRGMIIVLSPASVNSDNVMDEVSYALEERKPVVPVLYKDCSIPFRLRRLHRINFTADYDKRFVDLLRALDIEEPSQPLEAASLEESFVEDITKPSDAALTMEKSKPSETPTVHRPDTRSASSPKTTLRERIKEALPRFIIRIMLGAILGAIILALTVTILMWIARPLKWLNLSLPDIALGAKHGGLAGAFIGGISKTDPRVIATGIVGSVVIGFLWATIYQYIHGFYNPADTAVYGVPVGASIGALVGMIVIKWKEWT